MIKLKWIPLLLFTFSFVHAFSGTSSKEYQRQFRQAMIYVQNEEYKDALPVLTALNNESNNANLDFHIGLCNFHLQFDKSEALNSFDKAVKNIAKKYSNTPSSVQAPNEAIYFQGLCYHQLGQINKAIAKYEEYLKNAKRYSSDKLIVADAKLKLKMARETPSLFALSEHAQIIANRGTSKVLDKEFKPKLQKAMDVFIEDKIDALMLIKGLLKEYPNEPNLNYMMGVCLLNIKPYNELATDYFTVADKNISTFKESGIGLDCPLLLKYYAGIADQTKGEHQIALADFEAFNAVYPEDYNAYKPDFLKHMEYSRSMIKPENAEGSSTLASYHNELNITDTAGVQVVFPTPGTLITENSKSNNTTDSKSEYYYSVQVGAGNMNESYFTKITDLRTAKYRNGVKRFLTGKFSTKNEAETRTKELIGLGYPDAYFIQMKAGK
jgi:tetratricopeptide (TPR) repeat protein